MICTVGEAKKKWCPYNKNLDYNKEDRMCKGDGCMAWEWSKIYAGDDRGYCIIVNSTE